MTGLSLFWTTFFGWMPPILSAFFLAFIAISLVILTFKIVAFVMDIIPFI